MNRKISSEYGQIRIHRRVIRQISETAASQIQGVKAVGWGCYGPWATVFKFFNMAGTRVIFGNELKIIIPIAVVWDANIVDIAYEVQKQIITHMLSGLNIDSLTVDVKVKRVERG